LLEWGFIEWKWPKMPKPYQKACLRVAKAVESGKRRAPVSTIYQVKGGADLSFIRQDLGL